MDAKSDFLREVGLLHIGCSRRGTLDPFRGKGALCTLAPACRQAGPLTGLVHSFKMCRLLYFKSISVAQFLLGNLKRTVVATTLQLGFLRPGANVGKSDFSGEVRLPKINSLFFGFAFLLSTFYFLLSAPPAAAFEGPTMGPGQGTGAFSYTGGRFAVGTSTPFSDARFVIIATSTEPNGYAIKVVHNKCDTSQATCPQSVLPAVFSVRNDGSVVMGGGYFGVPSGGTSYYQPPNSTYERGLTVWGPAHINGVLFAGNYAGTVSSNNITAGIFNNAVAANYSFPSSLAIATTTNITIPQPLSVYGNAYVSGSVGIGAPSPSGRFHVASGTVLFANTVVNPASGFADQVGFGFNGSTGQLQVAANNTEAAQFGRFGGTGNLITFRYAGTTVGNIGTDGTSIGFTGGNVGIGTTGPGAPLHVYKMFNDGTDNSDLEIGRLVSVRQSFGNASGWAGHVKLLTGGSSSAGTETARITWDTGNSLYFSTGSSGAKKMTIDTNGNVGIATSSPAYALDVVGTIRATAYLGALNGTVVATNVTPGVFNGATGGNYSVNGSFGVATTTAVSLPQSLSVYGGGYFSGSVGIGTPSPGAKLHVESTIQLGTNAVTNGFINTPENLHVNIDSDNSQTNAVFEVAKDRTGNTGGTSLLLIKEDGNVGIGTTSPGTKLEISGGALRVKRHASWVDASTANWFGGSVYFAPTTPSVTNNSYLYIDPDTTAGTIIIKGDFDGNIANPGSGVPKLAIMTGNVGIGTTGPVGKLSNNATTPANVDGLGMNVNALNWTTALQGYTAAFTNTHAGAGNHNAGLLVKLTSADVTDKIVDFESGGVNRFRILGTGNVGIGTTGPTGLLHVVGSLPASVGTTPGTTATNVLTVTGGKGGESTAVSGVGGVGALISVTGGAGGEATTGGGAIKTGGIGGAISFTGGAGGTSSGGASENRGGVGGTTTISGGAGGSNSAGAAGGAGGIVELLGGTSGASGTQNGGNIYITGGALGSSGTGAVGNVLLGITSGGTARGNVGIGTASPATKLDVNGTVTATAFSGPLTGALSAAYTSAGVFGSLSTKGSYTFQATANTNPILFVDAANERVGIGTASPGHKLEVLTSTANSRGINVAHLATTGDNTGLYASATGSGANSNTALTLSAAGAISNNYGLQILGPVAAATNYAIYSTAAAQSYFAGNVGIGTAAPTNTLQVGDSTTSGKGFRIQNGSGASRAAYMELIGTTAASANQTWYNGVNVWATDASYEIKPASGVGGIHILTSGNVGIGTTAPGEKLQVVGNARADSYYMSAISASGLDVPGGTYNLSLHGQSNVTGDILMRPGWLTTGGAFRVQANTTDVLTVLMTGNVGIGTTGPGTKLDVAGIVRSSGGFTALPIAQTVKGLTWSRIVDLVPVSVTGASFIVNISGTRSNVVWNSTWQVTAGHSVVGNLTLLSSTDYTQTKVRLVVNGDGDGFLEFYDEGTGAVSGTDQTIYVAVNNILGSSAVIGGFQDGTTTTGYTVKATAVSTAGGMLSQGTITAGAFSGPLTGSLSASYVSGGAVFGANSTKGNYTFQAAGNTNTVLIVDATNERVGIGESTPVAKEHIQGSGTSGQVTASWILENSQSGTLGLDITGSAGSSYARWLYGGGPGTGTNSMTSFMAMVLEGANAGNVGIGTTGPLSKLSINGGLHVGGDSDAGDNNLLVDGTLIVSSAGLHAIGGATNAGQMINITGSPAAPVSKAVSIDTTITSTVDTAASLLFIAGTLNKSGSGTHADFSSAEFRPPTIGAGAAALTNSQTVLITAAPSVGTNLYALRVASGQSVFAGNVGIGTTNPDFPSSGDKVLTVSGSSVRASLMLQNSSTGTSGVAGSIKAYNGSTFMGSIDIQADGATNSGLFQFYTVNAGSNVSALRISKEGYVGIGTTNPTTAKLVMSGSVGGVSIDAGSQRIANVATPVNSADAATKQYVTDVVTSAVGGTTTSTGSYVLKGGDSMTGNLNMGGNNISGVNKLYVTTIDPLYEIGGAKYATYVPNSIGQTTSVSGKLNLLKSDFDNQEVGFPAGNPTSQILTAALDFSGAGRGSDLWLFWQTIAEGKNMKDIIVNLTPEFDGRAWYELRPSAKQIVVYAEPSTTYHLPPTTYAVSYHLTAPRHDAAEWPNAVPNEQEKGILLKSKTNNQ